VSYIRVVGFEGILAATQLNQATNPGADDSIFQEVFMQYVSADLDQQTQTTKDGRTSLAHSNLSTQLLHEDNEAADPAEEPDSLINELVVKVPQVIPFYTLMSLTQLNEELNGEKLQLEPITTQQLPVQMGNSTDLQTADMDKLSYFSAVQQSTIPKLDDQVIEAAGETVDSLSSVECQQNANTEISLSQETNVLANFHDDMGSSKSTVVNESQTGSLLGADDFQGVQEPFPLKDDSPSVFSNQHTGRGDISSLEFQHVRQSNNVSRDLQLHNEALQTDFGIQHEIDSAEMASVGSQMHNTPMLGASSSGLHNQVSEQTIALLESDQFDVVNERQTPQIEISTPDGSGSDGEAGVLSFIGLANLIDAETDNEMSFNRKTSVKSQHIASAKVDIQAESDHAFIESSNTEIMNTEAEDLLGFNDGKLIQELDYEPTADTEKAAGGKITQPKSETPGISPQIGQFNQVLFQQSVSTIRNESNDVSPLAMAVLEQIVEQIDYQVKNSDNQLINIRLKPDHLGNLNVKLSVEHGVIHAEFSAENLIVRDIIQASLPQLRSSLQHLGMTLGEINVNLNHFSGSGQFGQNQQRRNRQFAGVPFNSPGSLSLDRGQEVASLSQINIRA